MSEPKKKQEIKKETKKDRLNNKIIRLKQEYKDLHITDSSVSPMLTETNINILLTNLGIELKFNEVSKTVSKSLIDGHNKKIDNVCKSDKTLMSFLEDEIIREEFHGRSFDMLYRKLDSIAYKNSYNPVKDYLMNNYENNKSKLNGCYNNLKEFTNILKVKPDEKELTNLLVKRWLVSCVACQLYDDFVSHGILTLKGGQGIGKTSFFRRLIPDILKKENKKKDGYFKEGYLLDLKNKDKIIQFLENWIVELGELDSTARKQIDELKAFITSKYDTYRSPFGRTNEDYKRRTIACASIDKDEFLRDDTNRRFWVINCLDVDYLKEIDIDMLWVEIVDLYLKGEKWYLTKEELKILNEHNSQFNMKTETDSLIESCFDWNSEERYYLEIKDIYRILLNMNKNLTNTKIGIALKKLKIDFKEERARRKFYLMPKPLRVICKDEILESWNYEIVKIENVKGEVLEQSNNNYTDESILKHFQGYNMEQLLNFHKKLNNLIYQKDKEIKVNRGETVNKIFMDNIWDEWYKEIELTNDLELFSKWETIYNSEKLNIFLFEHNKNPTISKVEFLKAFDIDCVNNSISHFVNS